MKPLANQLLFATDFSECAARAEQYAVLLAKACGAALDIVHVLEFQPGMDPEYPVNALYIEELRKVADSELAAAVRRVAQSGITATTRQVFGIPSQRITELAKEKDVDLVVLGTHGRTGLEHILLGSTAERVVRGAPCPVLTVRVARLDGRPTGARTVAPPVAIHRILVPVDFSDCSLEALEYAIQVGKQFGAAVAILHVMEPVSYGLGFTLRHVTEQHLVRARLDSRLAELAATLASQGLQVTHLLRGGTPADSILDSVRAQECDLIVMGTHGRRGISHLVSGSVAEAVLRRADCPVLTVKSPKFGPRHQHGSAVGQQPARS